MEKKVLLAVDGSRNGFQVASIIGQLLNNQLDTKLVVLHCVQQLSSLMPGDLCLDVPETCRIPLNDQERVGKAVLGMAHRHLVEAGISEERIETRTLIDSIDPAQDILKEADAQGITTIILGRRGKSQLGSLLLGSISNKVAQYAKNRCVWIVDTPIHQSHNVLIAMEGQPDSQALTSYAVDFISNIPGLKYTLLHLMPPVPPTFWDDGHILAPTEQKDRQSRLERWASDWIRTVEKFMARARTLLIERGVPEKDIETAIIPIKEGVARDLLNEISAHQFQIVLMGKRSFAERKPFLIGSHSNKVLQNASGAILCLVDSKQKSAHLSPVT